MVVRPRHRDRRRAPAHRHRRRKALRLLDLRPRGAAAARQSRRRRSPSSAGQLDTAKAALDLALAELEKEEEKLERETAQRHRPPRGPRRGLRLSSAKRREPFVDRQRLLLQSLQSAGRRVRGARRGGPKPVERFTASYQCAAQTPSVSRGPAGQLSIVSLNGMPSAAQSRRSTAAGSARSASASMTGGGSPTIARPPRKAPPARTKPISSKLDRLALGRIGGEHARRMADQEGVPAGAHPVAPDLRQHVMRHVLLVEERLAARRRAGELSLRPSASRSRDGGGFLRASDGRAPVSFR